MNFKLINLEFWPRRLYLTTGVAQINQNLSHKLISRVRQRLTLTIHYKLRSGDNQIEKQSVESNESVDRSITLASIDSSIGRQLAQVDFPFFLFFQVSQVHWRRQVQAFRLSTEKAEQKAGKKTTAIVQPSGDLAATGACNWWNQFLLLLSEQKNLSTAQRPDS